MKLAGSYCFLVALRVFVADHLAFAQPTGGREPSAPRYGLARFAEEEVKDTGVAHVHAIPGDEHQVEEELVEVLETDELTTVVGDVELGELLCDSLEDASDSSLLRFTISSTETVIAERTSYSSIDGSVLSDGITRKTWLGEVVDPEPSANSIPRTVSMTWTDPCDIESFLLKLVTRNSDGSTSIVTSVPCSAGASNEICMVELEMFFHDESEAVGTTQSSSSSSISKNQGSRMLKERRASTTYTEKGSLRSQGISSDRRLQGTTVIDVLIVYSPEAANARGIAEAQLLTRIVEAMVTLNQAITNSGIAGLEYRLVHVAELPYSQMTYIPSDDIDLEPELDALAANSNVADLRDQYQGDLVQLVGYFPGKCGIGYIYNGDDESGFSLVDSNCFDNFSHTHEIAHNMGCYHDKNNSDTQHAYRHGYRYCEGTDPYRTIMSYYENGCGGDSTSEDDPIVPRVNYFSNPNVTYLNKSTGTAAADNARCIEDSMVAVSEFRDDGDFVCTDDGDACTVDSDCCVGFCGSARICATEQCGGAGGDTATIADMVCDPENNVEECQYDGGDCCECDCSFQVCDEDNTCVTPAWDCIVHETSTDIGAFAAGDGVEYCPTFSIDDLGNCDDTTQRCLCTCRESDPATALCGSGLGFDCIDPASDCVTEQCGGAGGDTATIEDKVCDPENNVEECQYDGGDCCECDCSNQACDADNICVTPAWDCAVDDTVTNRGSYVYTANEDCPSISYPDDFDNCDPFTQGCYCTCRESDPATALCGSGTSFDCLDPASDCGV